MGYEEYRDWLRDEFAFRCVYCLRRETWGRITGRFHIDHFRPVATAPTLTTVYDNLLYAFDTCNLVKRAVIVPDPLTELVHGSVTVHPEDGRLEAHTVEAKRLVRKLQLDTEEARAERQLVILAVRLASEKGPAVLWPWLRYPDELPDLKRKQPGGNSRPEGIEQSHFARRQRGELPDAY